MPRGLAWERGQRHTYLAIKSWTLPGCPTLIPSERKNGRCAGQTGAGAGEKSWAREEDGEYSQYTSCEVQCWLLSLMGWRSSNGGKKETRQVPSAGQGRRPDWPPGCTAEHFQAVLCPIPDPSAPEADRALSLDPAPAGTDPCQGQLALAQRWASTPFTCSRPGCIGSSWPEQQRSHY